MPPRPLLRRALPWILLVVVAAAHGALDVRRRARLDRGLSRHRTDLTVYLAASDALARGEDPYEARSPRGWRYVYPPLLAVLLRPLTRLAVPDAALVFYALSVAGLLLAGRALARSIGPSGPRSVGLAFLLASPFVLQTLQRGQVTAVLLATVAVPLSLLLRGRDATAGVVVAFGAALRLTPLLPAALLCLASVRGAREGGLARALRFPAGLLAGGVLFFAIVPAAALGPGRALDVTRAWLATGRQVYAAPGAMADLARDYAIREHSFKNQGVRRVAAEWTARATDAPRRDGEPDLGRGGWAAVDAASLAFAAAVLLGLAALAWGGLADRSRASFRRTWALACFAPVLLTRYAWPVHYVGAIPFLAEGLAGARPFCARAVAVLAGATVLFYAGHGEALRVLPDLGVLLAGAAVAAGIFAWRDLRARRAGEGEPEPGPPLPAYADPSRARALHRALRWRHGRLDEVAAQVPAGRVVDLGAGEGLLAHLLVRRGDGTTVLAVDHDEGRVARLRASAAGLPVRAVVGSLESFDPPRCDAVVLADVLHYLDPPAQQACLRRAYHALRPGGVLVLRDPDAGGGLRFLWTRLHERVATALGLTRARIGAYRSLEEWEAVLRDVGFDARSVPRGRPSAYADRIVVGRKPVVVRS